MSFLTSLVSAFKGGGGSRVPVARGFISPWATAFDGGPLARSPFDYAREVAEAYLANPVAQRSVRIVAEGVGSAPVACEDTRLAKLLARSCGSQPLLEVLAAQLALPQARRPSCSRYGPNACRWSRARTAGRPPIAMCSPIAR